MPLCWESRFSYCYAECYYAECRYAERRGAILLAKPFQGNSALQSRITTLNAAYAENRHYVYDAECHAAMTQSLTTFRKTTLYKKGLFARHSI